MTENKRFEFREVNCTGIVPKAYDNEKQQYANLFECVQWLNDLHKDNEQLKKLLELISRAHSFTKEESVKEILRNEIKGIDTAAEYSAMAWNDYCTLSNFFEKQYNEHWDNE